MFGGYAWLTNAVPPRKTSQQLLILVGMAVFLVVALAVPEGIGDGGALLGVGYLVVTLVHTGLFLRSTGLDRSCHRPAGALQSRNRRPVPRGWPDPRTAALGALGRRVRPSLGQALRVEPVGDRSTSGTLRRAARADPVDRYRRSVVAVGIGLKGRMLTSGLVLTGLL